MGYKTYTKLVDLTTAVTTTKYFDLGDARMFSLQTEYGSITGTFLVKSRVGATAAHDTFTYKTNTNISLTAPADDAGGEIQYYDAGATSFFSITYTHTSGTAALKIGLQVYTNEGG